MEVPYSHVEEIMKNAGAERVTEEAVRKLADEVEELGEELSEDAVKIAEDEGAEEIDSGIVGRAEE